MCFCCHMAALYKSGVLWRMFHLITLFILSETISVLYYDLPRRLSRSQILQGTW